MEEKGATYGLKLSKQRCEYLDTRDETANRINFRNGTYVRQVSETKYLGCMLNEKANNQREINKRIGSLYAVYTNLDPYWKNLSIPCKEKLITYDAIIKAKLLYGLDSAQINDTFWDHRLEPIYTKGLRNILRMQPWIDEVTGHPMHPSDDELFKKANARFGIRPNAYPKKIVPLQEHYRRQRCNIVRN